MKQVFLAGALIAVALTQAGCATQVMTVPLAAAGGESAGNVPVFFGAQDHAPVQQDRGIVSYSVRIARKVSSPEDACREALGQAVHKLRVTARERHANAVIDVSTRFHSTDTHSSSDFTCGVSPSAAAVAVSGRLVVLQMY